MREPSRAGVAAERAPAQGVGMGATTSLEAAGPQLRPVIERLWQLFSHDLGEFRDRPPDPDGSFPEHNLQSFFIADPDHRAYLVRHGDALAGFALVYVTDGGRQDIQSFFIVRALRRQDVGGAAARALLRGAPGRWEIGFQEENPGAARFWRRVAQDVAGDAWHEEQRPVPDKPWLPHDHFILLES